MHGIEHYRYLIEAIKNQFVQKKTNKLMLIKIKITKLLILKILE